jgi:hypothetical protein
MCFYAILSIIIIKRCVHKAIQDKFGVYPNMQNSNLIPKGLRQPKWLFAFWIGYCECNLFLDFETF